MIKYTETTLLILAWSFLLSLIWAYLQFCLVVRHTRVTPPDDERGNLLLPSLVLGPVMLLVAFRFFGFNLIFPLHLFATVSDLIMAAFFPAVTLNIASGMFSNLKKNIRAEHYYWRPKRFVIVGEALGKDATASLRRLVLTKTLTFTWSETLPWLFGELIIVEAIYNAPGLGLDAWQAAKIRDFSMLGEVVAVLVILYLLCVFLATYTSQWIGKRLESYE